MFPHSQFRIQEEKNFDFNFKNEHKIIFRIMFTDMDKVIISTGNILSVNKKVGQKAEDEVIEMKTNSIEQLIVLLYIRFIQV